MASPLLPFAQLEVPGTVPLTDGRYLVRPPGEEAANPDVLVLRTLGAPRAASRLRRGRPVALETEAEVTPIPLTRVTLIKAIPFDDERAAAAWLDKVLGDGELTTGLAGEVALAANRAIVAHRVSAPDRYALPIHAGAAAAVRFGYGSGEEVAEGRWSAASELAEKRRKGLRAELVDGVGAQERVAAVLGGRDRVLPHENLLLDAELAFSERRRSEAVLIASAALEAAGRLAGADAPAGSEQALEAATTAVAPLREVALTGGDPDRERLEEALKLTRRAVRAVSR